MTSATTTAAHTSDYYELLGLDRGLTTEEIHELLEQMKNGWLVRGHRAGKTGQDAQTNLVLIEEALKVFASDATRSTYEASLERSPVATDRDAAVVDWTARAWSYYFADDDGAAWVAARKAKTEAPDDAMAYVVAAWVHLWQDDLKAARADSDEAFVLDDLGNDSTDVHHVRGAVYHRRGLYTRALKSYDRALRSASPLEHPELHWRQALSLAGLHEYEKTFDACMAALTSGPISDALRDRIDGVTCSAIDQLGRTSQKPLALMATLKNRVETASVDQASKATILKFIDLWGRKAQTMDQIDKLRREPDPVPPLLYGWVGKAAIGAVISLVVAQIWPIGWVLLVGCVGLAAYSVYITKQYNDEVGSASQRLTTISELEAKLQELDTTIDGRLRRTPKAETEYSEDIARLLDEI